jgi:hypothetical protein
MFTFEEKVALLKTAAGMSPRAMTPQPMKLPDTGKTSGGLGAAPAVPKPAKAPSVQLPGGGAGFSNVGTTEFGMKSPAGPAGMKGSNSHLGPYTPAQSNMKFDPKGNLKTRGNLGGAPRG